MAKKNGNGNGDDWKEYAETAGNAVLAGVGGPVVAGLKAGYDYFNKPKTEPKSETPTPKPTEKSLAKKGVKEAVEKAKQGLNEKDFGIESKVEGSLSRNKPINLESMGVEKQGGQVHIEPRKAQPIDTSGSRPERKVEKLPEPPKPKHKLSPKEVVTNMKLGINHMRQLNEQSREK